MIPLVREVVTKSFVVVDWKPYKHAELYKATVRAEFGALHMHADR